MNNYASLIRENLPSEFLDLSLEAARLADGNKQGAVLVGGVVRDLLMGNRITEIDLMVDPPVRPLAEELAKITGGKLIAHETFHTFSIHMPIGSKVDVVTAREESYKSAASLPDVSPSTISHDLKRRDFSVNAMALWLNQKIFGDLLDPFDGASDIKKKLIRVLHPMSFVDDPTRIYRAARFAGRFGFHLEEHTDQYLHKAVSSGIPSHLSPVRRRHEFESILKEGNPVPALKLLKQWNVLSTIHPNWDLLPDHLRSLGAPIPTTSMDVLTYRLVEWLRPWGEETAKVMMTDLSFEKPVKKRVLMEIGIKG